MENTFVKKDLHSEHQHSHTPKDKKILGISLLIITGYMVVEFLGGYFFNSLALMADAGHMANDSLSLMLALIALFLSVKWQKWFALLNGASLIGVAIWILLEAVERWQSPTEMIALPMLSVAVVGLLVNILVAWIMLKSNQDNLNVRAAYLHVLADLFGSVVAIVAGLSAYLLNWQWVDVVASVILSLLVLRSGVSVVCQAFKALRDNSENFSVENHDH
ncbi:cation diffusion facilitator family transporter [Rodentibacter pneumotropicus]|nr:cation diffusion facilitator family transporter [Rodentibacter pneumotropicus]MDC2826454.1 cation diffusion facilitator family transporter [Rodentibacter pneumotropicus]NBH76338.1 cation transporter [Rodentibacter pneumotropicus]OOF64864.1 Co/Zn/Cd efflux system protein [Rodentibacter pneumotropicus]THA07639.1 cation transporter [Rodentibacter pneumotropicus]THA10841.1 cation transporter [Rodentibacter pneumotropicus]